MSEVSAIFCRLCGSTYLPGERHGCSQKLPKTPESIEAERLRLHRLDPNWVLKPGIERAMENSERQYGLGCPDIGADPIPDPIGAGMILREAEALVEGDRAETHGPKERNHQNIADHWNAYLTGRLNRFLTAHDVALMMVELKIARTKEGVTNRDNYVDMAGYAGLAGEIALGRSEIT